MIEMPPLQFAQTNGIRMGYYDAGPKTDTPPVILCHGWPEMAFSWRHQIKALSEAGIPTGVMFAPAIPALNDGEMEAILSAAAGFGAKSAGYVLLRLPLEIKDLFREWLEANEPGRAKHVMSLVRSMRGGKDYDANWSTRMKGTGPYAEMMARRFHMAVKRLGLNQEKRPLVLTKFRKPPTVGDQLSLFGSEPQALRASV